MSINPQGEDPREGVGVLARNYTRTGFWCPTNTGNPTQLWLCNDCGSVVHNKGRHDYWHGNMARFMAGVVGNQP